LNFGRSAILEVRKAVWPTRQETIQATVMVTIMVIIMGIILWLFDMMLLAAVQMLTGQGG
ncbi:MAG: preprotein translocase subunit SecE, partial [Gammaproteobacteria bacterium]|nr:preprotein translocase subunit SecE [Gammaproteobacteria bacterium]